MDPSADSEKDKSCGTLQLLQGRWIRIVVCIAQK